MSIQLLLESVPHCNVRCITQKGEFGSGNGESDVGNFSQGFPLYSLFVSLSWSEKSIQGL